MVWQAKEGIVLEQSTSSQAELEAEVVTWQVIDLRQGVKNLPLGFSFNSSHIVRTLKVCSNGHTSMSKGALCCVSGGNYKTGDDHIYFYRIS